MGAATLRLDRELATANLLDLAPTANYVVTLVDRTSGVDTEVVTDSVAAGTGFAGKGGAATLVAGHTYAISIDAETSSTLANVGLLGSTALRFDNVALTPKPYQKPWPEIRIAANSADTFPQIAKLGHGVFVAVRLGTLDELEPNITAYRNAWKEAGHPGNGQVFLRAPVYVAENDKAAREEPEESIMYFYRYLGERLEDSATRAGVRAVEDRAARGRRLQEISYEDALREKLIVGSPGRVTDRLLELKEKLGLDGILCEMNCGTKIPHQRVMKSLQLLCNEVMPRFN